MEFNTYIVFLLLTVIIEILMALAFKFRGKFILVVVFLNLISHPLATICENWLENYVAIWAAILMCEFLVVVFEYYLSSFFSKESKRVLAIFWISANFISFIIGFIGIFFINRL